MAEHRSSNPATLHLTDLLHALMNMRVSRRLRGRTVSERFVSSIFILCLSDGQSWCCVPVGGWIGMVKGGVLISRIRWY